MHQNSLAIPFNGLPVILRDASAQTFAHFLRQTKGRAQTTQSLLGRSLFLHIFAKAASFACMYRTARAFVN